MNPDDELPEQLEEWELTDEMLAEMASGELRRVKIGDRVLLMTKDEIRAVIEHALKDDDDQ